MLDSLSLFQEVYNQASLRLCVPPKRWPMIVNKNILDFFLSEYKKETGNTVEPDEDGVYLIYGNEVVLFDKWDENNVTC